MDPKTTIRSLLCEINNEELRKKIVGLYDHYEQSLKTMPASIKYHQNWKGGLYDHVLQVMTIALDFYDVRRSDFKARINRDDVIIVTFLHDFDKLNKYVKNKKQGPNEPPFAWNYDQTDMNAIAKTVHYLIPFGVTLTDKQLNALTFSHGGWSRDKGSMGILATVLHSADLWSTNVLTKSGEV